MTVHTSCFFALRDIYRDGYDISDFGLVDDVGSINEQISAFHFCNSETGQMFDMACFGGAFADDSSQMLQPSYLDVKGVQQPAPNIKPGTQNAGKDGPHGETAGAQQVGMRVKIEFLPYDQR